MSETKKPEPNIKNSKKKKQPMFYQITQDIQHLDNTLWDDFDEVKISEKYILEMLTMYWPNGKKNLTKEIQNKLIGKILRCMPNKEKLREQIKTAWSQKEKFMSEKMLEDLEKRKRNASKTKSITKKKKTTETAVRLYGTTLKERLQGVIDQVAGTVKEKNGVPLSLPPPPQQFEHFSIDQGNIGICYMVAVIVLFKNEFSILAKLKELVIYEKLQEHKVDETIVQLLDFLDKDYSIVSFNNSCPEEFLPAVPKSWQKSVYETCFHTPTKSDIVSGGDPAFLLTFIFAKLDAWHDSFNVAFDYAYISDDDVTFGSGGKLEVYYNTTKVTEHSFIYMLRRFAENPNKNIALIEMQFGNIAKSQLNVKKENPPVGYVNPFKMVDNMARLPFVRGCMVQVSTGNEAHVFAGMVYNENVNGTLTNKVVYCNSWGERKECEDSDAINKELFELNPYYQITAIYFVLRKQKFFQKNKIFSSDDEEE
jgi:hypothetical protein